MMSDRFCSECGENLFGKAVFGENDSLVCGDCFAKSLAEMGAISIVEIDWERLSLEEVLNDG